MCTGVEPWVIAAISGAATAAGTAKQISSNKKVARAREQAALSDLQRKTKTSDEANQLFQAELENSKSGDAEKDVDLAAQQQLAEAQALTDRENTGFTAGGDDAAMASATPIVKEVAARQLGDELAKAEGQMRARAMLQGFQQRQIKRGTQFGRAAERMRNLGNFNQGWDQVAQTQQQLAANAGNKDAMLGDALVGLGAIGMSAYGAYGAGAGAGAAKGATGATVNPYNVTGATTGLDTSRTFAQYPTMVR